MRILQRLALKYRKSAVRSYNRSKLRLNHFQIRAGKRKEEGWFFATVSVTINDKARINYCILTSVYQYGGPSRPRQNCHSCIFETKENSNLRICIQYLGHYSKTTCQKSAKSMRYRVRPKFEFYRKSLLRKKFRPDGFRLSVLCRSFVSDDKHFEDKTLKLPSEWNVSSL